MKIAGALCLGLIFFLYGGQAWATTIDYVPVNFGWEEDFFKPIRYGFLIDNVSATADFQVTFDRTAESHSYVSQMFIYNESHPFRYEGGWIWQTGTAAIDWYLQRELFEGELQFREGNFDVSPATPVPSTLVKESDKRLIVSEKRKPLILPVRTTSNSQGLGIDAQAVDKAGRSHEIKDLSSNKTIVKSIKYKIEKDREKVFIALNNFSTPKILTLKGDKPRIVIDIKNVSSWSGHYRTPVNGNLIKQIRTHLHRDTEKLRIVLDINPSENYFIDQIYNQTENIYCIEVR